MGQRRKREGDYDRIVRLYELYEKKMYIVAFSILKNQWQAEDAVSEAFIKIIRHRDKLTDIESDETKRYIIRLIQNTAIDFYRKNQTESAHLTVLDGRSQAVTGLPEDQITLLYDRQRVKALLDTLPEKIRQVMLLRCVHELTVREIATVLQVKETAVRKRFERGKKLLKASILNCEGESGGEVHEIIARHDRRA